MLQKHNKGTVPTDWGNKKKKQKFQEKPEPEYLEKDIVIFLK